MCLFHDKVLVTFGPRSEYRSTERKATEFCSDVRPSLLPVICSTLYILQQKSSIKYQIVKRETRTVWYKK